MPPKSIFRQPGAKHFQLVHRSQRDPQIHNPDASDRVLKEIVRTKKGKSRAEIESLIDDDDANDAHGQAALYGVYFDDTQYDYMQHLRDVGVQEDGVDSVLIEAPTSTKRSQKSKGPTKTVTGIALKEIPQESLPSTSELPRTYESQQAIPESIAGFQPDMNPHLRQALEALEDEAFVDDELDDDFFGDLVKEGELGLDEELDFEFHEDGVEMDGTVLDDTAPWEQHFAQFKKSQQATARSDEGEDDLRTEGGDTVAGLPSISVIGGKKRRKGTSDASGYSMSSSSMFRNDALKTLDDRFDQVMLKQYDEIPDDDEIENSDDEAPELQPSREDFSTMVNEFLDDFEILGRKMQPKLAGGTGAEKLDTLRKAMGQDDRVRNSSTDNDDDVVSDIEEQESKKDRWDCETILTTYSNLENHPRLIRARDTKPIPRIHLDAKTGLPTVLETVTRPTARIRSLPAPDSENTDESEDDDGPRRQTVARPRNETPEDRRTRKAAVKAQRANRRVEKKMVKEAFGNEFKDQSRTRLGVEMDRRTRKL